jgi:uncharacterized protein YecE (DUF72 family)
MATMTHDPGTDSARERATSAEQAAATRLHLPSGSEVLIGTASWTDPTMTAPGVFYPDDARTPEARLRYYASRFPLVEVDSTYYALPKRQVAELWAERTPEDFVFDIKAFALMTGHPTEVARLPRTIREMLPEDKAAAKRVYPKDLPPEAHDAVWSVFLDALEPLRAAGKLGAVLFQYPRWFMPSRESARAIAEARMRLGDVPCAVEFRHRGWLEERLRERTAALLAEHGMTYVIVDEPQGMRSSVPPVVAVTTPHLAVVRLHGRRADTWERPTNPVSERYRYLYDRQELEEWVPRIEEAAKQATTVHTLFNNCYGNYGTTNAVEMASLMSDT